EFRLIFHAPSQKFKILVIPNILAHGNSYEYCFIKICDDHKLYTKSRAKLIFDRFFVHCFENSKDRPFMGSSTSTVLRKNMTIINFTHNRV
ncbi:hypothetical protein GW17_00035365, partial [Ensete ventricosum]